MNLTVTCFSIGFSALAHAVKPNSCKKLSGLGASGPKPDYSFTLNQPVVFTSVQFSKHYKESIFEGLAQQVEFPSCRTVFCMGLFVVCVNQAARWKSASQGIDERSVSLPNSSDDSSSTTKSSCSHTLVFMALIPSFFGWGFLFLFLFWAGGGVLLI